MRIIAGRWGGLRLAHVGKGGAFNLGTGAAFSERIISMWHGEDM